MTANPYELTARYRLARAPARRVKSGIISRRRRRTDSTAISEGNESNRTLASAADSSDFDKDFLEDYDFDGKLVDHDYENEFVDYDYNAELVN